MRSLWFNAKPLKAKLSAEYYSTVLVENVIKACDVTSHMYTHVHTHIYIPCESVIVTRTERF